MTSGPPDRSLTVVDDWIRERIDRERATNGSRPPIRTFAEIERAGGPPPLPPPIVAPMLWPGHLTMFASREKAGKSTFAGELGLAVLTGRLFLGASTSRGSVAWVGLEEHPDQPHRRLKALGLNLDVDAEELYEVGRAHFVAEDPLDDLRVILDSTPERPHLAVIDSLSALSRVLGIESGDARGWHRLVQGLADIAHDSGTGILLIHHARKSDGEYRDSTSIGAAADMIATMKRADDRGRTGRALSIVGRFGTHELALDFVEGRYVRVDNRDGATPTQTIHDLVLSFVEDNPGATVRDVVSGVSARKGETGRALAELVADERVRTVEGSRGARRHYLHESVPTTGALFPEEEVDR